MSARLLISPLEAPLGAVVENFDARAPSPADILALKAALRDYLILIFKHQDLSDDAFLRFATHFGSIFVPPRDAPVLGSGPDGRQPDIVKVSNFAEDGVLGNRELTSHSDHHWTPVPSAGSLLYAVETPKRGGETSFINLAKAYETLDDETKAEIDGLRLITYNPFLRAKAPLPQGPALYRTADIEPLSPHIAHPLVRTHPDSGRRLLYLGEATEVEIVGYAPERGASLIARLRAHLANPDLRYTHAWTDGDIVYWDNQITSHARAPFDAAERRLLKRISLAGSRPF